MNSKKSAPRRVERHLFQGENGYFARMGVPVPLRPIVGKRELWSAVPAETDAKARRKLPVIVAGFHATLDAARAEVKAQRAAPRGRPLAPQQLAVAQYDARMRVDDELRNADHRYAERGFVDSDHVERLRDIIRGAADNDQIRETLGAVLRFYEARGHVKAASGSPQWREAARALAVAELEALARTVERDEGDFNGKPSNPLLIEKPQPIAAKSDALAARMLCDDSSKTLAELLPAFLKERNASPHVEFEYRATVRMFDEVCGEPKPVYAITKQDVRSFKDALGYAPAFAKRLFKGMTLPQAIAANKARKTPYPTLNSWTVGIKYFSQLRSVLEWCADNETIPDSPAANVKINAVRRKKGKDFSPGDLTLIFAPERFKKPFGEYEWAQLLALFTGGRASELAQIQLDAIRERDGCVVLELPPIKRAPAGRLVPVHSSLIALGFKAHVTKLRAARESHLFPEWYRQGVEAKARAQAKGTLSLNLHFPKFLPKKFNREAKALGIVGKKSFHSFRHTFTSAMQFAGIDRSVQTDLVGHADASVHGGYIHRSTSIKVMRAAIEKLRFDGFTLA